MLKEATMAWHEVPSWHLPTGTEENHKKLKSGQPISGPRFEHRTSQIQSRSDIHSIATLNRKKNCNFNNHNRKWLNIGVSCFVSIMLNAKSQKKNNTDDYFEEPVQEFLTFTKEARNICKSHLSCKLYIGMKGTKMLIPTHLLHKKQELERCYLYQNTHSFHTCFLHHWILNDPFWLCF
jgi:hypothetical protein